MTHRIITLALIALLLIPASAVAQPAPPRVLILGDSLSGGAHASNPAATYAARVAVALDATDRTLVQPRVNLEGAEVGWGAHGHRGWDIVVVEVGINDSLSPTLDVATWSARYRHLVASVRAAGASVVCVTPFDIGEPAIDLAARAALVRAACAEGGGRVADVWAATAGRADLRATPGAATFYGGGRVNDPYHPTDAGHALIAETILAALRARVYLPGVSR